MLHELRLVLVERLFLKSKLGLPEFQKDQGRSSCQPQLLSTTLKRAAKVDLRGRGGSSV
jgi:hypothetical protein